MSLLLSGASRIRFWLICPASSGITSSNCLAAPAASMSCLAASTRAASGACARAAGRAATAIAKANSNARRVIG
jgi:hypothetical protein